jgi:hypothetical protein
MKKFNVNDNVKVKLTDYGKKLLKAEHERFWAKHSRDVAYEPKREDANGYVTFQLWELMARLGPSIVMGLELPFKTEILIDDKHLEDDGSWKAKIAVT